MSSPFSLRHETTPFLLKLFYRTGAFHRPDEFSTPSSALPVYIPIYTRLDCTLLELAHHFAAAAAASERPLLPIPSVGTRLVFRLLFADTRPAVSSSATNGVGSASGANSHVPLKYTAWEMGSVVIREDYDSGNAQAPPQRKGRCEKFDEMESEDGLDDFDHGYDGPKPTRNMLAGDGRRGDDAALSTLHAHKFVIGDYILCAILPPDAETGETQPETNAKLGRGSGPGEAATSVAPRAPRPAGRMGEMADGFRSSGRRKDAFMFGEGRGGRGKGRRGGIGYGRREGRGGHLERDRSGHSSSGGGGHYGSERDRLRVGVDWVPAGEWRRGQNLPEAQGKDRGNSRR